MTADLFVKGARVVKPDAVVECGLAIREGVIAAALAPGETVDARRTIDAGGRYVLPGLLDTHLHLGTAAQSFAGDCASESRQELFQLQAKLVGIALGKRASWRTDQGPIALSIRLRKLAWQLVGP